MQVVKNMNTPIDAIINGIVSDLKKDGFSDKDIEMAVITTKKHYELFFGKPKKTKKKKEVDNEDDENFGFY